MRLIVCLLLILKNVTANILGINAFGYETEYRDFQCIWQHPMDWHISKIKEIGFNAIRLPFSWQFVNEGHWESMDKFFEETQRQNISVVLDFHRLWATHQSSRPYDDVITFDMFLKAWKTILDRYQLYPQLTTVDVFNEFQSGAYQEWDGLSRQIVNYIEDRFPERFRYFVGGINWGGNIHYANLSDLSFSDRITYSIHKYHFSSKEPLEENWDYEFGLDHLLPNKVSCNVGEYGFMSGNSEEVEWVKQFFSYLKKRGVTDTFLWCWSFNSGDTQGVLLPDCSTVDEVKMNLVKDFWKSNERKSLR